MSASKTQSPSWSPAELKSQLEEARAGHPFLVYRDGNDEQRIVPLEGSARLAIGRGPGDVELADDPAVSWLHAELELVGDAWLLLDDGLSRNGSFVNGERVSGRIRLRNGDLLRIGDTVLLFRAPAEREVEQTVPGAGPAAGPPPGITGTQREVLVELCRPLAGDDDYATPATNREIAARVHLSVDRVKAHMRALFERFGLGELPQNQKRLALARRALDLGAVSKRELRE